MRTVTCTIGVRLFPHTLSAHGLHRQAKWAFYPAHVLAGFFCHFFVAKTIQPTFISNKAFQLFIQQSFSSSQTKLFHHLKRSFFIISTNKTFSSLDLISGWPLRLLFPLACPLPQLLRPLPMPASHACLPRLLVLTSTSRRHANRQSRT